MEEGHSRDMEPREDDDDVVHGEKVKIAVVSGYFSDVCILWMKMFPIAIDWKCFPLPFKSFPSFAQTNLIFNPVYTSCASELDTYLLFSTISFVKHPLIIPLISFR